VHEFMTIVGIWRKYQHKAYDICIESDNGHRALIEGCRPADSDGGCMATGTPEAMYGMTEPTDITKDIEHWWHCPKGFSPTSKQWKFVEYVRDPFIAKCIDSSLGSLTQRKDYTVIRRRNGQIKIIDDRNERPWYPENYFIIREDR